MISAESASAAWSSKLASDERLPVDVGALVGGKYVIDAILGIGGMGVVAAATHAALGQRVALKVMRASRMNPETADRFLREARAAVSLRSRHVAKVLDVGTLESGLPYMVMELLEGSDLGSTLEVRGALPYGEAIDYVLQACDALSEAHALGIVHRDLKPANLFLTERRDGGALVKVLDFGISKVSSSIEAESPATSRAITHESTVMGSPMYMSPEQIRSAKHVDARTDLWALGAILYELVTGLGAFDAESVPDIFVKVLDKPAPRLEDARRDAPSGLSETIARCLEKDRDKRFQSVNELAAALASLGAKPFMPTVPPWDRPGKPFIEPDEVAAGAAAPRHLAMGPAELSPKRSTADTFVLPGRPRARRNGVSVFFAALAIVGVALAGVGGYRYVRRTQAAPPLASEAALVASPALAPAAAESQAGAPGGAADVAASPSAPAALAPLPPMVPSSRAAAEPTRRATPPHARPRAGASGGSRPAPASTSRHAAPPVSPSVTAAPATTAPPLRRTDW